MKIIRTGIYGGSFDPPHIGHKKIAESFLLSGSIDELWVMPTPVAPHKQNELRTNFKTRLKLCQRCFSDISRCKVSDFEAALPAPQFTWNTLLALREQHPDRVFLLCMGMDSANNLDSWWQADQIKKTTNILVASRPGESELSTDSGFEIIEHKDVDVAARNIREKIAAGDEYWKKCVTHSVAQIIEDEQLYR